MVLIYVPKQRCQSMIPFAHKKYLANKVRKVGVILEHEIKLIIGLLSI